MENLAFYGPDGATPITQVSLDAILGGAVDTAFKFGIRSSGDIAWPSNLRAYITKVGSSDGDGQFRIGLDTATLSPPWGLAGVVSAGGGSWGATGSYAAVVTAVNATGETVASQEAVATIAAGSQTITWGWAAVPGAVSYNVYRRAFPAGDYTTPSLIGNTASLSLADTGASPDAGAPPAANTTGGTGPAYGTPPTLGLGPASIGALAVGQWAFFWIKRVVQPGTSLAHRWAGIQFRKG